MHDFLSDDWMDAVKAIRNRYADEAPPVPYKVRLNQVITAVPFGDGERRIHIDTSDGTMVLDFGELENPDATITTDYETDPTHVTLLNRNLLHVLFVLEGMRRRADLERRLDWAGKGRVFVYERAGEGA